MGRGCGLGWLAWSGLTGLLDTGLRWLRLCRRCPRRRRSAPAGEAWQTAICRAGFADVVLLGEGGEAVGDDLHADVAAGGNDVDGRPCLRGPS